MTSYPYDSKSAVPCTHCHGTGYAYLAGPAMSKVSCRHCETESERAERKHIWDEHVWWAKW